MRADNTKTIGRRMDIGLEGQASWRAKREREEVRRETGLGRKSHRGQRSKEVQRQH